MRFKTPVPLRFGGVTIYYIKQVLTVNLILARRGVTNIVLIQQRQANGYPFTEAGIYQCTVKLVKYHLMIPNYHPAKGEFRFPLSCGKINLLEN